MGFTMVLGPTKTHNSHATFRKNVVHIGVVNWAASPISMGSLEIKGCI